jgi:hypothetical protein
VATDGRSAVHVGELRRAITADWRLCSGWLAGERDEGARGNSRASLMGCWCLGTEGSGEVGDMGGSRCGRKMERG